MTQEEFKAYQRSLNKIREAKLKEEPLPTKRPLLEPEVKFKVDVSDLALEDIPINIPEPVKEPIKEQPIKSNSVTLF
jgi:hypothetical protein